MNPAKAADLIVMPFGMLTRVSASNNVLDERLDSPVARDKFDGKGEPIM